MMDLGKFKAINDTLGQTVGDQVIKNFGRHLARRFVQSGSPIRWGGDEFVVVFKPSVKKGEAMNVTDRMLDTWTSSVSGVSEQFHPFVRVGFACYPDDIKDPKKLEDLASDRLKKLKGKKELYLFSWDCVPGDNDEKLKKFLRDDLDIRWTENAEIRKSDDGKTIRISKDEKQSEIILDAIKKKATLKISDGRTFYLNVKKKHGKLNIYKELSRSLICDNGI
jgi:diguanylate cyclase (GGDEF)-like protein